MQVPGAKDVAVEFFTLSKSYNMPGWRVGFMVGNQRLVAALARLKSYFDYGTFTPIQVAAIAALEGPQECVAQICDNYRRRRDVLVDGLNKAGWPVAKPKATMFVWAQIPEPYRDLKSLEFSKLLLTEAKTASSPGIGFGDYGDNHVRFALIENEERTRQALRGIKADAGERRRAGVASVRHSLHHFSNKSRRMREMRNDFWNADLRDRKTHSKGVIGHLFDAIRCHFPEILKSIC